MKPCLSPHRKRQCSPRQSPPRLRQALKRLVRALASQSAQATVEYLVVALATIAVISGLATLGSRIQEGIFSEHASDSASHAMTVNTAGSIGDVLLY